VLHIPGLHQSHHEAKCDNTKTKPFWTVTSLFEGTWRLHIQKVTDPYDACTRKESNEPADILVGGRDVPAHRLPRYTATFQSYGHVCLVCRHVRYASNL